MNRRDLFKGAAGAAAAAVVAKKMPAEVDIPVLSAPRMVPDYAMATVAAMFSAVSFDLGEQVISTTSWSFYPK